MRVLLDVEKCQGYACCELAAPEVFQLQETTNVVSMIQPEPPEELRSKVEEAVRACPVRAIAVEG
jgi:ferredoxin